jgi:hypothetical protein
MKGSDDDRQQLGRAARPANYALELVRTTGKGGLEEVVVVARRDAGPAAAAEGEAWLSDDVVEAVTDFLVELVNGERSGKRAMNDDTENQD